MKPALWIAILQRAILQKVRTVLEQGARLRQHSGLHTAVRVSECYDEELLYILCAHVAHMMLASYITCIRPSFLLVSRCRQTSVICKTLQVMR